MVPLSGTGDMGLRDANSNALSTLATIVAEFGDNLSPVWTGL